MRQYVERKLIKIRDERLYWGESLSRRDFLRNVAQIKPIFAESKL
jgi:hypothetical protein